MPNTDLITDLDAIRRQVAAEEDENIRFRQFLRYRLPWSDPRLDEFIHSIAHEVEAGIDCTQCGNCCRVLEVSLETEDLLRLADHLGRSAEQVDAEYGDRGTLCERAFAQSPCAFLSGNRCSVYAARPQDCRDYPHLGKPRFRDRMWQLLNHAEDCPIIFNTLRRLKQALLRECRCYDFPTEAQ